MGPNDAGGREQRQAAYGAEGGPAQGRAEKRGRGEGEARGCAEGSERARVQWIGEESGGATKQEGETRGLKVGCLTGRRGAQRKEKDTSIFGRKDVAREQELGMGRTRIVNAKRRADFFAVWGGRLGKEQG
ncbi:hypothetical protein ERJ75_001517200 [Trypanosoma vivax]|nr:hypothetical protein TRVL_06672 [Trypanosoma vivax]KAH8606396.1 hypothetical protein ERJ75_001517200 [Trypanosoma vivax]